MEKAIWTIYWNEYSSDTYLYGSQVDYVARNNVHFKNELMPPGTVIKQWYSLTNYQAQRIEPSLPIIDGESRYRIKINVDPPDGKGCLIRLVFLDRYEREVGDFAIRDKVADFSCPIRTYSYRMQLINAGMKEFTYHSITIEELTDEDDEGDED